MSADRPGGWVEGRWMAMLHSLPYDTKAQFHVEDFIWPVDEDCAEFPDGPVIVVEWPDGSTPEPPKRELPDMTNVSKDEALAMWEAAVPQLPDVTELPEWREFRDAKWAAENARTTSIRLQNSIDALVRAVDSRGEN